MADLSGIDSAKFSLDEAFNSFTIPARFRFMQELWIQCRIVTREKSTGSLRLLKPYPRMWTGYYYLLYENCIFKHGAIEFQNQEIYRQLNISWNTEIAVNETSYNATTPELPLDVDVVDELAEIDLWTGIQDSRNIYMPIQLPIDRVALSIPPLCEIEVLICGRKFSPISTFTGAGEIDIYEDLDVDGVPDLLFSTPANPLAFPPMDEDDVITDFDDIARARGYFPTSELDTQCRAGGYFPTSELDTQCRAGGYLPEDEIQNDGSAEQIISDLTTKGIATEQVILDELKAMGLIDPSETRTLQQLIDDEVIRASDLSLASRRISSPYVGKKAMWVLITVACQTSQTRYTAAGYYQTVGGGRAAIGIQSNSASFPTASTVPWSSVNGQGVVLMDVGIRATGLFGTSNCGDTTQWEAYIGADVVNRAYTHIPPQWIWVRQPLA